MSDYSPGRRRPTSLTTRVRRWVLLAVILLLLLLGLGYCLVMRDDPATPPVGGRPAGTAPATVVPTTPPTTPPLATTLPATPPAATRSAKTPPATIRPATTPLAKKAPASATVLPAGRPETGGGSTAGPDPVPLGAGLGLLLLAGVLMSGLVRRHRRTRSQA